MSETIYSFKSTVPVEIVQLLGHVIVFVLLHAPVHVTWTVGATTWLGYLNVFINLTCFGFSAFPNQFPVTWALFRWMLLLKCSCISIQEHYEEWNCVRGNSKPSTVYVRGLTAQVRISFPTLRPIYERIQSLLCFITFVTWGRTHISINQMSIKGNKNVRIPRTVASGLSETFFGVCKESCSSLDIIRNYRLRRSWARFYQKKLLSP